MALIDIKMNDLMDAEIKSQQLEISRLK